MVQRIDRGQEMRRLEIVLGRIGFGRVGRYIATVREATTTQRRQEVGREIHPMCTGCAAPLPVMLEEADSTGKIDRDGPGHVHAVPTKETIVGGYLPAIHP